MHIDNFIVFADFTWGARKLYGYCIPCVAYCWKDVVSLHDLLNEKPEKVISSYLEIASPPLGFDAIIANLPHECIYQNYSDVVYSEFR